MKGHYTINYQDFANEFQTTAQVDSVSCIPSVQHRWGSYQEKCTLLGPIKMYELRADLNSDFNVLFRDEQMTNDIHFCSTLKGNVKGTFCNRKVKDELMASQHHYIYAPDSNYELVFKNLHVLHLAIDRNYFINLIDGSETWMEELRKSLHNQDVVQPGTIDMAPKIKSVLLDLLEPTLTGNLQNLMLEAKALELIALQLDQYRNDQPVQTNSKKKDREVFHAIHEHLTKTFASDHSLQSLSREFGINEFKLKQGFRQYFGTTVFDFIFDTKMKYAWHLISEEEMYLHEVSRKIGYKNPNHFSTAFKKKFGFSPNELKNNN
ncbi:MAG TPA: AraC family transcriptional regulator [Cyclobacteriaceae bacterium]